MGQASHKLQHAGVFVRSKLSADELLRLAEQVAESTQGAGKYRKSPIRIVMTDSGDNHRAFAVVNPKNVSRLRFEAIGDQPAGEGGRLGTRITRFQTRQSTMFFGLVPAGPKELVHYHFYEQYMRNLQEAVWGEDPEAEAEVRDQA